MEDKNIKKIDLYKKEKCQQLVKSFPKIDEIILHKIENEFEAINEEMKKGIVVSSFSIPNEIIVWVNKFYELELSDINYIDNHKCIENKEINELTLDEILTELTFYIRQDRFCTGLLANEIKNGTLEKLIKHLDEFIQ